MKIEISPEDCVKIDKNYRATHVHTGYSFLKQHNGLRPSKLHLFIGTPGGGKSTLRNSLIIDFLKNNPGKRVMLYLSEESIEDFKVDIVISQSLLIYMRNLRVLSEEDEEYNSKSPEEYFAELLSEMARTKPDLIIFDNITTSELYGENVWTQSKMAKIFKSGFSSLGCPVVLFAHTGGNTKQSNLSLIDQNEIRGSKKIVNLAEFLYIMQNFHVNKEIYSTLRIIKHRAQAANSKIFKLNFTKELRIYETDKELPYREFKDYIKNQN